MLFLALLPLAVAASSPVSDARIRVNTVGFLPDAPKIATIAAECTTFEVVRASDGKVVYSQKAGAAIQSPASDTNETVQTLDFTALKEPGSYRIVVPAIGSSEAFEIEPKIWNEPFEVVSRAMYLWRCGTAVEANWHGKTYRHDACHLDDAWLDFVGGGHTKKASTGGWHDAGDYNKYPVNTGVSLGFMLKAWEHFGSRIANLHWDIPESTNNVPDLLDEIRWEAE